jgi:hypothetical protein
MFFPVFPGMPGIGIIEAETPFGPGIFHGRAITGYMPDCDTLTLGSKAACLSSETLFSHNQILL